MILPAESFRVFLSARSFAAVSGETETAMRTRFTAFVLPARFAFPRIEAEIFAFVAELFEASAAENAKISLAEMRELLK